MHTYPVDAPSLDFPLLFPQRLCLIAKQIFHVTLSRSVGRHDDETLRRHRCDRIAAEVFPPSGRTHNSVGQRSLTEGALFNERYYHLSQVTTVNLSKSSYRIFEPLHHQESPFLPHLTERPPPFEPVSHVYRLLCPTSSRISCEIRCQG